MNSQRTPSWERDLDYCPSPKQIREACIELRMKWTEKEEEKRRVCGKTEEYTIPVIVMDGVAIPPEE
jgi:hypothetical protein